MIEKNPHASNKRRNQHKVERRNQQGSCVIYETLWKSLKFQPKQEPVLVSAVAENAKFKYRTQIYSQFSGLTPKIYNMRVHSASKIFS